MYDIFNIALEKTGFHLTETADGRNIGYIRWGIFEGADGKSRIAAFYISMPDIQFAHMIGKDPIIESNAVAKRFEAREGPAREAYQWLSNEFVSVNSDQQTWFRFR